MIDISKRVSRGAAVFWLTLSIVVVGVILVVRATSGPAYEATAKIVIGFEGDPPPDQVEILRGATVAAQAESLIDLWASTDPETLGKDWPEWLDQQAIAGISISSNEFLNQTSVSSSRESNQIKVSFTADTAERARLGANSIVEAYRQIHGGTDLGITSGSLAPTPRRINAVDAAGVWWFVLGSILVMYFTWAWWPGTRRQYERPDHVDRLLGIVGVVVLLFGLFTGTYWLMLGLLFAVGLWSVGSLLGRYLDLLARYVQKSKQGRD